MKGKILSIALAVAMVASTLPVSAFADTAKNAAYNGGRGTAELRM